jgi:hypothetical protein
MDFFLEISYFIFSYGSRSADLKCRITDSVRVYGGQLSTDPPDPER